MEKKTFKEKLLFAGRKFVISIKRNYYIIPLIMVGICCFQFMCSLYIISPVFSRITNADGTSGFTSMYIFIITLLTTLATVAYLNYALVKYGKKRPVLMLILYALMTAISVLLLVIIMIANLGRVNGDVANYNTAVNKDPTLLAKIQAGLKTNNILITQLVLQAISILMVATAPIVQAALNKIKFKRIEQ